MPAAALRDLRKLRDVTDVRIIPQMLMPPQEQDLALLQHVLRNDTGQQREHRPRTHNDERDEDDLENLTVSIPNLQAALLLCQI